MSNYRYCALLKFGKLEHLISLREEGNLHCKTLNYFADLEDDCYRGDPLEKVNYLHNFNGGQIHIKEVDAPDSDYQLLGVASTGVLHNSFESSPGNIFCMYSFRLSHEDLNKDIILPDECVKLGDHYLVIKDYEEFIKRVAIRIEELNLTGRYNFVGYKDFSKFTGRKTVFEKDSFFALQKEFRIFINNLSGESLDIRIGSIADISEICKLDNDHAIRFFDEKES